MSNNLTNGIPDINGDTPLVVVGEDKFRAAVEQGSLTVVIRNREAIPVFQTPFHHLDREGVYIATANGKVATARLSGMDILGEETRERHKLPNRPWTFTFRDVQPIPLDAARTVKGRNRFIANDLVWRLNMAAHTLTIRHSTLSRALEQKTIIVPLRTVEAMKAGDEISLRNKRTHVQVTVLGIVPLQRKAGSKARRLGYGPHALMRLQIQNGPQ